MWRVRKTDTQELKWPHVDHFAWTFSETTAQVMVELVTVVGHPVIQHVTWTCVKMMVVSLHAHGKNT